ncbi:hypothetical protein TNCV_2001081 [Trichonephila clavipes]|nr:hypothetical protein TNCV_2001081 [Trichonephila clavipes]
MSDIGCPFPGYFLDDKKSGTAVAPDRLAPANSMTGSNPIPHLRIVRIAHHLFGSLVMLMTRNCKRAAPGAGSDQLGHTHTTGSPCVLMRRRLNSKLFNLFPVNQAFYITNPNGFYYSLLGAATL